MYATRRNICTAALVGAAAWIAHGRSALAEPKVPSTPEEHFALAKQYRAEADAYRKEAQDHREMAAAYRKDAIESKGSGRRNAFVVKMEKHCGKIAAAADALAVDAQKSADFHDLRGKELQGK